MLSLIQGSAMAALSYLREAGWGIASKAETYHPRLSSCTGRWGQVVEAVIQVTAFLGLVISSTRDTTLFRASELVRPSLLFLDLHSSRPRGTERIGLGRQGGQGEVVDGTSHHNTLLVVAIFGDLSRARGRDLHGGSLATTNSGLDDSKSLFRAFVSSVGRLNVPDVGLQNVTTTSDAHLREVPHSVLCLDETCIDDPVSLWMRPLSRLIRCQSRGDSPSFADLDAHSYASSSSLSSIGGAPTMYHAHSPIMAAA